MRTPTKCPFNVVVLLLISSCATVYGQPIARIQFVHNYTYPGNAATFPSNNAAGNAIVVMASWYAAPGTPTISDTRGNTYTMLPPLTGGGAGNGEQTSILIWYALNIAPGANTVTISGAGIDVGLTAVEYSGVATSGAIGITSTLPYFGGTPTTTPTSNSFTPSAGSLLFVAFADETNPQNSIAAGSGYTLIQGDGNHVDIEEDNVNSSAGAQTASISVNFATWSWAMYVVELLPSGGSSTPPIGTVLWSNPGDGSGIASIVPAVPSASGVADVFALQNDGTVMAVTSDGTTAWTANVLGSAILPDFQGGLIVSGSDGNNGTNIFKLDGITGQPYPTYDLSPNANNGAGNASMAVHTDGTIFAMTSSCTLGPPPDSGECTESVIGIDPIAGAQKFSVPFVIPRSTPYLVQGGIIAGDGYYYVAFITEDSFGGPPDFIQTNHLSLLRVNSAGASDALNRFLAFTNSTASAESNPGAVAMITNADTGIFLTLATYDGNPPLLVTTTGTSFSAVRGLAVTGGNGTVVPILQAQDGSFVGSAQMLSGRPNAMVAFDASGNVRWTVPNETPLIATADAGFTGQSGTTYDQNGNATGQISLATQSWTGNAYQFGPSLQQLASNPTLFAFSFAAYQGGNPSTSKTYVPSQGATFRALVASTALGYVGNNSRWLEANNGGTTTCNLFVRDCLIDASNALPLNIPPFPARPNLTWYQTNFRHPFLAADWANPTVNGGCWKPLPAGPSGALPGDVIATGYPPNGNDGTGHVGIIVSNPGSPYIDASAGDVAPYFWTPAQQQGFAPGTITLTDYGFRAPGYNPASPQDVQGLRQDSRVRRFSCY